MSIRPDPFEQMEAMFDQMRRAAFGALDAPAWDGEARPMLPGQSAHEGHAGGPMRVSLEESDDGYLVLADVPGFEEDEIDLSFHDSTLTVTATHEANDDDSFRSRRVHESVHVPATIDVESASATYRNGVLEVTLPAVEHDEGSQRIEIE